ncbi:MAG: NADPH-dependent FMN reductase [Halosimplex sp.]
MSRPDVVAVCGSRREGSYTRRALRIALDAAREAGARTELLDLRTIDLPPFDPDAEEGDRVTAFKRRVREADAVILGSPVYHGSYSATLKDALDYCGKDEFTDTTVGLLATAGGGSYASTLDHLRTVVRSVHGWTVPTQVGIGGAYDAFDGDEIPDPDLEARVRELGREVVANAAVEPAARTEAAAAVESEGESAVECDD